MKACKLCKSQTQPLSLKKLYHWCGFCGFIWLDSEYYLEPDAERERYLEHNNVPENQGYVQMFGDFLAKVEPWSRKGRALDFGCGPGPVLADILKKRGWDTDIYDPFFAPESVFLDKKFQLITCTEVMEHIAEPLPVWKLLADALADGGVLAVMTHLHPGPDSLKDWWYIRDATHVSFYSRATMTWLARTLGLKEVYCDERKITVFCSFVS